MNYAIGALWHLVPLLVGLSVLVFVHELGHYLVARWAGVRVEIFSIGFGPELIGWNDGHGTRWRISAVPLGGYVMMFGDPNVASMPDGTEDTLTPDERKVALQHQPLPARAAIIAAGPVANFLYAVVVSAVVFVAVGVPEIAPSLPPIAETVGPDSAAASAGIQAGDQFLSVDGKPVSNFDDLVAAVRANNGEPMHFQIRRDGQEIAVTATPEAVTDGDSATGRRRLLGIGPRAVYVYTRHDPLESVELAAVNTWSLGMRMLRGVGEMLIGAQSARDVGGIISAGVLLDNAAQEGGLVQFVLTTVIWSINLGLVNLFPIPVLDGGHLLFYAAEAVLGRPLGRRTQEYGFRIGLALVLTLMVFANGNDVVHRVIPFLRHLFT